MTTSGKVMRPSPPGVLAQILQGGYPGVGTVWMIGDAVGDDDCCGGGGGGMMNSCTAELVNRPSFSKSIISVPSS